MKKLYLTTLFTFVFFAINVLAVSNKDTKMKKGILLVTFGTSYPAGNKAFQNIEDEVKNAFPNTEIRWAYTSKKIRKKLKKQGIIKDAPAMALAKMADDGFTHVAVQSLHIIPGGEYRGLTLTVFGFTKIPKSIIKLTVGKPLLYSSEDVEEMAQSMHEIFRNDLAKYDAIVFMGHGTERAANIYYPGSQYYLQTKSDKFILGTVEGFPTFANVINGIKSKNAKSILLTPFMSVAGDHAQNDMAGSEPDSWKSKIEKAGIKVTILQRGMAEYDSIVAIWIKHLKIAYDDLDKKD